MDDAETRAPRWVRPLLVACALAATVPIVATSPEPRYQLILAGLALVQAV